MKVKTKLFLTAVFAAAVTCNAQILPACTGGTVVLGPGSYTIPQNISTLGPSALCFQFDGRGGDVTLDCKGFTVSNAFATVLSGGTGAHNDNLGMPIPGATGSVLLIRNAGAATVQNCTIDNTLAFEEHWPLYAVPEGITIQSSAQAFMQNNIMTVATVSAASITGKGYILGNTLNGSTITVKQATCFRVNRNTIKNYAIGGRYPALGGGYVISIDTVKAGSYGSSVNWNTYTDLGTGIDFGPDDFLILKDSSGLYVQGNTAEYGYDTGIELVGTNTGLYINGNRMSHFSNAAYGGWYGFSLTNSSFVSNTGDHVSNLFIFGYDGAWPDTVLVFTGNSFMGNTLTNRTVWPQTGYTGAPLPSISGYAGIFDFLYDVHYGTPTPAGTSITVAQNAFSNNDFMATGPNATGLRFGSVGFLDDGGNKCATAGETSDPNGVPFPIVCH